MEGLRSWVGDGLRFMEAVWIVSAIWRGREDDMLMWLSLDVAGGG